MLLSQVLCYLISTLIFCFITLAATRDWAKIKPLSSAVNRVLITGAVRVTSKAFYAAELGVKEAL
jgi:hypothetical protein